MAGPVGYRDGVFASSLTVFFPAFNDAPSLPELLARTFQTLRGRVADYEVIVVNDGSSDGTGEVLRQLAEQYAPYLRVITHEQNRGYGGALRSGFLAAAKDYVFYTDGDGQYDPRELARFLDAAAPDVALVNGYKTQRNDPWHRVAIGWLYNRFARWLFRIRLRDIDCDFRLIRRGALRAEELRSTGGTICVELVRSLELTGMRVVELPVGHYARLHGTSQFFRLRSLAATFVQLLLVFWRLVLRPGLAAAGTAPEPPISRQRAMLTALAIAGLAVFAYGWRLSLPFISDDYVQIQLSRDFGPMDKWPALARDALYRCRATSLVFTYWLERTLGLAPVVFNAAGLLLHIANSLLVFALGIWRPVGWRVSALSAIFFAVSQRHSEAVIWFAAVPELLVFLFMLAAFLCWVRWLQGERPPAVFYAGTLAFYLLALLSKESAVALVPLCALAALFHPHRLRRALAMLVPMAAIAMAYFGWAWLSRDTHLHFNDGTFSLSAPVGEVMFRSMAGLLWVWGMAALALAAAGKLRLDLRVVALSLGWMMVALLPYSFLTYMPRVPSRHTYLASVGLAILVAAGFHEFQRWAAGAGHRLWAPVAAAVILGHQCGYLWFVLQHRYQLRAEPTERLLRVARQHSGPIHASCFPYAPILADYAFRVTMPPAARPMFLLGKEPARAPDAVDFCNEVAEGVRY